jgi:hypothetical protein
VKISLQKGVLQTKEHDRRIAAVATNCETSIVPENDASTSHIQAHFTPVSLSIPRSLLVLNQSFRLMSLRANPLHGFVSLQEREESV